MQFEIVEETFTASRIIATSSQK